MQKMSSVLCIQYNIIILKYNGSICLLSKNTLINALLSLPFFLLLSPSFSSFFLFLIYFSEVSAFSFSPQNRYSFFLPPFKISYLLFPLFSR